MTLMGLEGRRLKWLVGSVSLSAIGYLAFAVWGGWREVVGAVGSVGVDGLLALLALSLCNYLLRFIRWQYYLFTLGHPVQVLASASIYLAGFALTTSPGKAGELLRGVFLKRRGVPYTASTAAFVSERLSDLIAILVLSILGAGIYAQGEVFRDIGATAVVVGILFLRYAHRLGRYRPVVSNHQGRFAQTVGHILDLLDQTRTCHRLPTLLLTTGISIVAWAAEAYGFYLLLTWMGQDVTIEFAFSVYALSMLAGAITFLPGGLGGAEAVMIGLLLWMGMPEAQAIAATVLVRLATLWFAVVLGILSLSLGTKALGQPPQLSSDTGS